MARSVRVSANRRSRWRRLGKAAKNRLRIDQTVAVRDLVLDERDERIEMRQHAVLGGRDVQMGRQRVREVRDRRPASSGAMPTNSSDVLGPAGRRFNGAGR
jgi:hypothetical protein